MKWKREVGSRGEGENTGGGEENDSREIKDETCTLMAQIQGAV